MSPGSSGRLVPDSSLVDRLVHSPNVGVRKGDGFPKFLIMHYTGLETVARSIAVLSDPACEVSCHYVVDVDGSVVQMVQEADRAWHAGVSYWQGETDINSYSIGIEIQNEGHVADLPDFPEPQMLAVEQLALDIVRRHQMRPEHVLAHSDIAPQRKIDPGEKFDWARLNRSGVGHWVMPMPPTVAREIDPAVAHSSVTTCQRLLASYGYDVPVDGLLSEPTRKVISAFQRHFRPERVDGLPDQSTIGTLQRLIDGLGCTKTVST